MAKLLSVAADVSGLGGVEEIALLLQLGLSIRFQVDAPLQNRIPEHCFTLLLQHLLSKPLHIRCRTVIVTVQVRRDIQRQL